MALSGGGASGAFGAGILVGWQKSGTRPKFDVVTGISAGALIAPFAFLGPQYDDTLEIAFTTVRDSQVYWQYGLVGAFFDNSLSSNAPLARMLDQHVTEELLDQVAGEHDKGRRLFIGATNLDADRAVIWDMGPIAASGQQDQLKLFKQVILASTSIPGIFPPVQLKVRAEEKTYREMHVDGGTSNEIFLLPAGLALGALDKTFRKNVKARLYVIRNGRTTPEPSTVNATLPAIAKKAISSLIKTQAIGDLYRLYAISERDGIDYNYVDIPPNFTLSQKAHSTTTS